MLPLAALLDIIGIICFIANVFFGIGEILSFIPDFIGLVLFGMWVSFRAMTKQEGKEKKQGLTMEVMERKKEQKTMKMKMKMSKLKGVKIGRFAKFGLASIGELIPIIGVLPFWTIYVYWELKSDE
jgi:hypothetical protein